MGPVRLSSVRSAAWLFLLPALAVAAVACQRALPPAGQSQVESQRHLREALVALEGGDSARAESQLKASLEYDPQNDVALTTLASIYALDAGVELKSWFYPVLDAAQGLVDRVKRIEETTEALKKAEESYFYGPEGRPSPTPSPGVSPSPGPDVDSTGSRAAELTRFLLGAQTMLEVFHSLPLLTSERLVKLDRAIAVLRVPHLLPSERPEGARVYLAVLSLVRLVHSLKVLMVDPDTQAVDITLGRFCKMRSPALTHALVEVRSSMSTLREGITVGDGTDSPVRRSRRRVELFLQRYMDSPVWSRLESLSDGSDDVSLSTRVLADRVCGRPLSETVKNAAESAKKAITSEK